MLPASSHTHTHEDPAARPLSASVRPQTLQLVLESQSLNQSPIFPECVPLGISLPQDSGECVDPTIDPSFASLAVLTGTLPQDTLPAVDPTEVTSVHWTHGDDGELVCLDADLPLNVYDAPESDFEIDLEDDLADIDLDFLDDCLEKDFDPNSNFWKYTLSRGRRAKARRRRPAPQRSASSTASSSVSPPPTKGKMYVNPSVEPRIESLLNPVNGGEGMSGAASDESRTSPPPRPSLHTNAKSPVKKSRTRRRGGKKPEPSQPKSVLVGDFLTKTVPGDEEYDKIVQNYLVPHCSFNYVGMAYFDYSKDFRLEPNRKANAPLSASEDPGRFTGMRCTTNFYEPQVFRAAVHRDHPRQGREGLCPYCLPHSQTSDELDRVFFNLNNSSYLHHVTKQHGVYSSGSELAPPAAVGQIVEEKEMKNSKKQSVVDAVECPVCHERVKIQKLHDLSQGGNNRFLAYFRHLLGHNEKKNGGRK